MLSTLATDRNLTPGTVQFPCVAFLAVDAQVSLSRQSLDVSFLLSLEFPKATLF